MNALTPIAPADGGTTLRGARVLARANDGFTVLRDGAAAPALRAFACLVEPEPGDLVLVGDAEGACFILSVLARRGDAPMRVALPDGAAIGGAGALAIAAEALDLRAARMTVAAQEVEVAAARTAASLGRATLLAEAIETLAQRIVGRFRRSVRVVEESDQVRAKHIDQRASGHLHLRGDALTVQGSALVKLRADQIHLG
jgi:hypothetical protein